MENLAHNFSDNLREVESAKHASKLEFLRFSESLREKKCETRLRSLVWLPVGSLSSGYYAYPWMTLCREVNHIGI